MHDLTQDKLKILYDSKNDTLVSRDYILDKICTESV